MPPYCQQSHHHVFQAFLPWQTITEGIVGSLLDCQSTVHHLHRYEVWSRPLHNPFCSFCPIKIEWTVICSSTKRKTTIPRGHLCLRDHCILILNDQILDKDWSKSNVLIYDFIFHDLIKISNIIWIIAHLIETTLPFLNCKLVLYIICITTKYEAV